MDELIITKEMLDDFLREQGECFELVDGSIKPSDIPFDWNSSLELEEMGEFESIEKEAAELLSHFKNCYVSIPVCEITEEVAIILSKHEGQLVLNELCECELSKLAAESLSQYKGRLSLRLDEFNDFYASIFSNSECDLELCGFDEISDTTAQLIAKKKNGDLVFHNLAGVNDAVAESLSNFSGGTLGLWDFTEISESSAKFLAKIKPDQLEVTDEVEEIVANLR